LARHSRLVNRNLRLNRVDCTGSKNYPIDRNV
jgi:hypothetical protein